MLWIFYLLIIIELEEKVKIEGKEGVFIIAAFLIGANKQVMVCDTMYKDRGRVPLSHLSKIEVKEEVKEPVKEEVIDPVKKSTKKNKVNKEDIDINDPNVRVHQLIPCQQCGKKVLEKH